MRAYGARQDQLAFLARAAGLGAYPDVTVPDPVQWPWKTRSDFHQRLREALSFVQSFLPPSKPASRDGLRYVAFLPDEASFLLHLFQEYWDCSFSREEWDKEWRYYPACRMAHQARQRGFNCSAGLLIQFSIALHDQLGLTQFDGAALPLEAPLPAFPWKTTEELRARTRDVKAYRLRKDRHEATVASCQWRGPIPLRQDEVAYLDAWLQEQIRGETAPAVGEQSAHGGLDAQLMNLVWASDMEIEPRDVSAAPWPWRSEEEFHERLRSAASLLYSRARLRPKTAIPFNPAEVRFIVAWIQEDSPKHPHNKAGSGHTLLDLLKTNVPEMFDEDSLDSPAWLKFRAIELAWLKVKGLHRLAIAGGPRPAGNIVYPWKDGAAFETRYHDSKRILEESR
jgi:hypothetical protein